MKSAGKITDTSVLSTYVSRGMAQFKRPSLKAPSGKATGHIPQAHNFFVTSLGVIKIFARAQLSSIDRQNTKQILIRFVSCPGEIMPYCSSVTFFVDPNDCLLRHTKA